MKAQITRVDFDRDEPLVGSAGLATATMLGLFVRVGRYALFAELQSGGDTTPAARATLAGVHGH